MRSVDELTLYVGGLLDPDEERELRGHLDGCVECRHVVARLLAERDFLNRALARDIVEAPVLDPDPDL